MTGTFSNNNCFKSMLICTYFEIFLSDEKFYYNIISGVVAGAVAAALCNPTDLLKVNIMLHCICSILLLHLFIHK